MTAKISVFVICFEVITYLFLYNLYDCTFNQYFLFISVDIKHKKFSDVFREVYIEVDKKTEISLPA